MHFDKHITDDNKKLYELTKNVLSSYKVSVKKANHVQVTVKPEDLLTIMHELKENEDLQFKQLVDITAVDYPSRKNRFDLVYMLLSHRKNYRIFVKLKITESENINSVVDLFKSADWHEREVYDLFGIKFNNHPNLKRILTDYGFKGHPLRKDFPIFGETDLFYDEQQQDCVYKDVELPEETRFYNFSTNWDSLNDNFDLAEFDRPVKKGNK